VNNLKEALGILLKEQYAPYLVSSLYLHLAPEDRTDKKYLRVFKDMVKVQKESLELRGLERDVVELALEESAVVEIIVREDLQKKFDGVGALLRWRI
jgi:peptide chain release factor subunit 1